MCQGSPFQACLIAEAAAALAKSAHPPMRGQLPLRAAVQDTAVCLMPPCLCAGGGAQEPPRLARGSLPTQLRGRLPTRGSLLNLFSRNTSDGDSITSVSSPDSSEDTCKACHPEALLCCLCSAKPEAPWSALRVEVPVRLVPWPKMLCRHSTPCMAADMLMLVFVPRETVATCQLAHHLAFTAH